MSQPHTMMEYTHKSAASRDRFIRTAEKEMAKFERRETEFRKKDREERKPLPKGAPLNLDAGRRLDRLVAGRERILPDRFYTLCRPILTDHVADLSYLLF
jgi:nitric oxide reductase activation protein